jgi:Bacterial Ig domain
VGTVETQMFADGSFHWGQIHPAVIPSAVCVKDGSARDLNGNIVPFFSSQIVTDEVTIAQALYDRSTGTLTVAASSSDVTAPPTLTLAYGTFLGDLVNGQISVPNLIAPPGKIRVLSSALGASEYQVRTNFSVGTPPNIPVSANDSFTFIEDSGPQSLVLLANDSNIAGGIVTLTSLPRLGSAVVNPGGDVTFTPNLDANGADAFTYTVTVGTNVSNTATVTLNITPVNDAPVAVNDSFSAIANQLVQLNVLANDTDPDGPADLAAAQLVTSPAAGATVTGGASGVFAFNATAGGTYSFTYQAQDASLATSANTATVTVQVAATETLTITRAEYVRSKGRLKAQGTISPAANQTITMVFVDASGTVLGAAGSTVAVAGSWLLDTVVPLPTGTTAVRATSSNGTARVLALTLK